MKKAYLLSFSLALIGLCAIAQKKPRATQNKENHTANVFSPKKDSSFLITLKSKNFKEGIAYLCYRMGEKLNVEDSAAVNGKGIAIFEGNRRLPGGIYTVVFPGKNHTADFFLDKEQEILIEADTADLINMKVIGSPENKLFYEYQKFVGEKGTLMQNEKMAYITSSTKADSVLHEEKYLQYNKELTAYRENIIKNQPESMMAVMLNAMKEPELPIKKAKSRQDTLDNYHYYKKHYWDGVTFMDERIIRTPFFMPKLEQYYRDILPQIPDSLIQDIDYKLLLARTCPEMFKFLLNWVTDEYLNPKIMGLDAVFVHLFEKYHSKGISSWLNEKQMETISRRAYMQMSNLIGATAANLEMMDSTGKTKELYSVAGDYTLVVFWDPTCGHCKEEIPRIDSIYQASWKKRNVKIYAVLTEPDKKTEWVNYIKEHKIGAWTHVYQTKEQEKSITDSGRPGFRQLYDVISTPTLFLLDKDKRIVGKKLSWQQLDDFLQTKWNEKKG
ncbi:MAG: redoxin domain-containing protein [Ferruginibacter sp.]|nr:redoxin domain-containing protein [Ferruginibacter sp.]